MHTDTKTQSWLVALCNECTECNTGCQVLTHNELTSHAVKYNGLRTVQGVTISPILRLGIDKGACWMACVMTCQCYYPATTTTKLAVHREAHLDSQSRVQTDAHKC